MESNIHNFVSSCVLSIFLFAFVWKGSNFNNAKIKRCRLYEISFPTEYKVLISAISIEK